MNERCAYGVCDEADEHAEDCTAWSADEAVLTDRDVFTLMGHAEFLRGQGQTDMPAYLWKLAARIARAIGDEALEARVRALAPLAPVEEPGLATAIGAAAQSTDQPAKDSKQG